MDSFASKVPTERNSVVEEEILKFGQERRENVLPVTSDTVRSQANGVATATVVQGQLWMGGSLYRVHELNYAGLLYECMSLSLLCITASLTKKKKIILVILAGHYKFYFDYLM